MNERLVSEALLGLEVAAFEPCRDGGLRLLSRAPDWLTALWPHTRPRRGTLQPDDSPFLENFLVDAQACWRTGGREQATAGPWVETDARGAEYPLEVTALTRCRRRLLLIRHLGPAFNKQQAVKQTARTLALLHRNLQKAERALAEANATLEQKVRDRTRELEEANKALAAESARRQQYAERLEGMREVDKAILAAQSPETIAAAALRRIHPLLPYEYLSVLELDPATRRAIGLACLCDGRPAPTGRWELSNEQLSRSRALESGQPHHVHGARNLFEAPAPDLTPKTRRWRHIVDFPMVAERTIIGVLNLATDQAEAFPPEHEEIAAEIAGELAVAIRQARLFALLAEAHARLRAMAKRLLSVQEEERRRLARELHDEFGGGLSAVKILLDALAPRVPDAVRANLVECSATVADLILRVRERSLDLRPPMLDDLGLLPALAWHFGRLQRAGLLVEFQHAGLAGRLPPELEIALFRIVQEALTNVARHAKVPQAIVRLTHDGKRVRVQVKDEGVGFEPGVVMGAGASSGLHGIRERALLLGGDYEFKSAPGRGARITVDLPLPPSRSGPEARGTP